MPPVILSTTRTAFRSELTVWGRGASSRKRPGRREASPPALAGFRPSPLIRLDGWEQERGVGPPRVKGRVGREEKL